MSQPGTLRPTPTGPSLVGQATGQLTGRALSAGQLPPPAGPAVTGQATGQLPGRTLSAGQLPPPTGPAVTGQVTGQLPGQTSHQPPGQIFPTGQVAGIIYIVHVIQYELFSSVYYIYRRRSNYASFYM